MIAQHVLCALFATLVSLTCAEELEQACESGGAACAGPLHDEASAMLQLNKPQASSDDGLRQDRSTPQVDCTELNTDWIIVGGGAAGCAAAAALADAGEKVLVLERGPSDKDPTMVTTQTMDGWPAAVNAAGELIRWNEGVWGAAAKVLGGGTSLNAGLYLAEREEWFATNMPGVDFAKIDESYAALQRELASPVLPTQFGLAWNDALQQGGYGQSGETPEYVWAKGRPFVSYSIFNMSAPGKPRLSAATLLHHRSHLSNLVVKTDASVQRVIFNHKQATGVRVYFGQGWYQIQCPHVRASKGVIVSAGTILSPQLLQISGVGPADIVEGLGRQVVADLPVGSNFTDRLVIPIGMLSKRESNLTVGYTVVVDESRSQVIEGIGGGAVTSELALTSIGFVPPSMRTDSLRKVLSLIFAQLPTQVLDWMNSMFQPVSMQTNTHSRGFVRAVSQDPSRHPEVQANYYQDPRDWQSQKERFHYLLELVDQEAMESWAVNKAELFEPWLDVVRRLQPTLLSFLRCFAKYPDNNVYVKIALPCLPSPYNSTEARDQYLRDYILSSYHYFGTNSVGMVVDQVDFSVKGTENLYVVDASIMPVPSNVNPQGTVMALGHYLGSKLAEAESNGR